MRFIPRNLAAAAVLCGLASVHASTTVIETGSNGFSGGALTWSASLGLVDTFNVLRLANTAVAPASVHEQTSYDPVFEENTRSALSTVVPLSSITLDQDSRIVALAAAGGMTWTVPPTPYVSRGGVLTIENIQVDVSNKRVYASLTGDFSGAAVGQPGNGTVSRIDNFHLWDIYSTAGNTQFTPSFAGTINPLTFSSLLITANGFNHFVSALRLQQFGVLALQSVGDYGTLAAPVPETTTTTMTTVGVGLLALLVRRRRPNGL
jgi:hypothetical protein